MPQSLLQRNASETILVELGEDAPSFVKVINVERSSMYHSVANWYKFRQTCGLPYKRLTSLGRQIVAPPIQNFDFVSQIEIVDNTGLRDISFVIARKPLHRLLVRLAQNLFFVMIRK